MDVTAVVTLISGIAVPIGLIGGAVLLIKVGVRAYKWLASAV
jgi:hypothetical protein